MKNLKSLNSLSLLLLTVLSLGIMSCNKSKVGPAGAKGDTGNANVKTVALSTSCTWKVDSTNNAYTYRFHIESLDNTVLQRGAVMVYSGSTCGCEWRTLPFKSKGLEYSFSVELSTVEITVSATNGLMPVQPGVEQFKVVMIPPAG